MSGAIVFEHEYRDRLWRFQLMRRDNQNRLHVWAWFRAADGEWRPCRGREVGFVLPIERLSGLREALAAIPADVLSIDSEAA